MGIPNSPQDKHRDGVLDQTTQEGASVPSDLLPDENDVKALSGSEHRYLGTGIVILAICALLWWETTRFPEVPAALSQNISAAFFPKALLATAALLAIIQIFQGWHRERERLHWPAPQTWASAVAIILGVVLLPSLGMLSVVFLIAIALPLILGERRWRALAIYSVALPIAIWLVFTLLLQLRLPTGVLGF